MTEETDKLMSWVPAVCLAFSLVIIMVVFCLVRVLTICYEWAYECVLSIWRCRMIMVCRQLVNWVRGAADDDKAHYIRYSNVNHRYHNRSSGSNHDHQKHPHESQADAENEIRRMRQNPHIYDECHRLNSYYSKELGAWLVGRSDRR